MIMVFAYCLGHLHIMVTYDQIHTDKIDPGQE